MSTGQAIRACLLNSALLETGVWRKSTAFRHFSIRRRRREETHSETRRKGERIRVRVSLPRLLRIRSARSSKRAGGLIPRIALDQCRVPDRYRTRAPAFAGRPASIKVMQRTFNPWNRARYPGGPPISNAECRMQSAEWPSDVPTGSKVLHSTFFTLHFFLPGRLTAGQRPLKALMVVRVHPRQPFSNAECKMQNGEGLHSKLCILNSAFGTARW